MVSEQALRRSFSNVRRDISDLRSYCSEWIMHLDRNQQYMLQKIVEMQGTIQRLEQKVRDLTREKVENEQKNAGVE